MTAISIEEHGDWLIWHDPLPTETRIADWQYCRKIVRDECDYGRENSREMCLQTIDFLEEQDADDAAPRSRESTEFLDRFRNVPLVHQLGDGLNAAVSILATNGRGFADAALRAQMDAALVAYRDWQQSHA